MNTSATSNPTTSRRIFLWGLSCFETSARRIVWGAALQLLLLSTATFADLSADYQSKRSGSIGVIYSPADSVLARKTLLWTEELVKEMAVDFQLPTELDTFTIFIAASQKDFTRMTRDLPRWVAAVAIPSHHKVMLKSPAWDNQNNRYRQILAHELMHLLLYQIVGNRALPRWLDEGLALFYSQDLRFKTLTALSKAAATRSLLSLQQIDHVLQFQPLKAELAYEQSYSAVHYLLFTYDIDALRSILAGIRQGGDLDEIFQQATGSLFADFEREWQHYVYDNYRWVWLSDVDEYLWVVILLLGVLAVYAIRRRNRQKMSEWALEPDAE